MPFAVRANGVAHSIREEAGWLSDALDVQFPNWIELLRLGAVYVNKKRSQENAWLCAGDYVRVHPNPRRFNLSGIDWEKRIVCETDDWIAVDKPAGVPVHATVDNQLENLIVELALARGTRFLVTHRIDTVTSGLILLAKEPAFQRWFNRELNLKKVHKTYLALSHDAPESLGHWKHMMEKSSYLPKRLTREGEGIVCETTARFSRSTSRGVEVILEPLTGRTHQLRAQMAFEGAAITGDILYGGSRCHWLAEDQIALHAARLVFNERDGRKIELHSPPIW